MINPLNITEKKNMELKKRYKVLYSGVIYDTMYYDIKWDQPFTLHQAIKPAWNIPYPIFGHAFTVRGHVEYHEKDINDTLRIEMLKKMTPGCIQVMDTNSNYDIALFGDISGKLAKKFGCIGAVIDGNTRDLSIIEKDGFPVFCRSAQPDNAYGIWGIKEYQCPISMSGIHGRVTIRPDDYIFGDPDGIIVIPNHLAHYVCQLAEKRVIKEDIIRKRIDETDDIQKLYDEYGSW
jgi:regulator of RNase E activity RraA